MRSAWGFRGNEGAGKRLVATELEARCGPAFLLVGLLFAAAVALWAIVRPSLGPGGLGWVAGSALVLFVAAVAVAAVAFLRGRRRVVRAGYLLCPGCRYPLSGAPSPGNCPECGRSFEAKETQDLWRDNYG